jgi:hypothetical protein
MSKYTLFIVPALSLVSFLGCSSSEEYEVTGQLNGPQSVTGPISVSFYEVDKSDTSAERSLIKEVEIAKLGAFNEKIDVADGNKVVVMALVDADADDKCTEGELWAEDEVEPTEDGKLPAVSLTLAATACPAAAQ